ncbi:leucine-rich repeat receptor-like serine/threonine-protein kinase At1g17230 isoform X1 [Malania oleifera]|uniref:leucine-rich repeat receptor-like serine/threonine-protein kinase At1g17230 isoform X1 n=1 Tax=Malania oleifera TaxID=397392 RepID=UPI0025AE9665|nr:leucine-rich repeat receptor-like serine/threonine-protein kinase At1g17230 isoform X1 [Malania oleifera]
MARTVAGSLIRKHFRLLLIITFGVFLVRSLNEEGAFLLEFKQSLIDPNNNLQSWNSSHMTPCSWAGIGCSSDSKVISVELSNLNLSGNLSFSSICKLPQLTELNISRNFIIGPIPKALVDCHHLEVLDLCTNRLHGELPTQLSTIATLTQLYLCENFIYGAIPQELGNLTSLKELVIYSNNLTGTIPPSIGMLKKLKVFRAGLNILSGPIPVEISDCESLEMLGLAQNQLEGSLPWELQRLKNLSSIYLAKNRLSGEIPVEIGNFSNLAMLALNENSFSGRIPKELGKLTHLTNLYLYTNQLNGTIPRELRNCVKAMEIDLSENRLSGLIPKELAQLANLTLLHLFENQLQGGIPRELGQLKLLKSLDMSMNNLTGTIPLELQNLTFLEDFQLFDNHLDGTIPPLLGSNSKLNIIDMSVNNLVGSIPAQLCKFQTLLYLSLGSNKLSGNIPHGIKTCKSLRQLRLGDNRLTGSLPVELSHLYSLFAIELNKNRFSGLIPPEVGKIWRLQRLLLSDNYFVGQIPHGLGNLVRLVTFNISSNQLSGSVPRELGKCKKLQRLDISRNQFTGHLPEELGELVNLELLKLSDNKLTGQIPRTLGGLTRLTDLQMGGNHFSGSIPVELGQLAALQIALNISYNALSGTIPPNLGNLQMLEALYLNNNQLVGEIPASIGELSSLLVCNLSDNKLVGTVPNTPVFYRMDSSNFARNDGLCILGSYHCHQSGSPSITENLSGTNEGLSKKIVSIISVIAGLITLMFTIGFCWFIRHHRTALVSLDHQTKPDLLDNYYFPKEGFTYQDLLEATGNFSESAVIGRGACGTVYKAVMASGEVIAIKKLKSRGEVASVDGSFRAEITTLGKIRHRNIVKLYGFCYHQDSNLLLYEYMANGSLGEQLHGNGQTSILDWNTRYKIALGAAEGLCYLHYDCKPQIIHRDIKSNNILLDEMLQAHVGDFGLAKLVDFSHSKSMSTVAGSYGYIAPEYAYTLKVTEKCDIYSFGVVLLELVTGRSPVQPLDQGGDLVTWVRRSIHNAVPDIFDKRLDLSAKRTVDEISLILKIALFCTSASPLNRPTMKEVIAMMMNAREAKCNLQMPSTSETPLDEDTSPRANNNFGHTKYLLAHNLSSGE